MPDRLRWPRRGVLAMVAAVVMALASGTTGSAAEPVAAPAPPPSAAPVVAAPPEPLRIMPLGSSSTVGTGGAATAGFRGPLTMLLARDRIAVDMVGSQRSGPAWLPDPDHEGHGGATMAQMQPHVAEWVARQNPDLVLLQVGTNDLITGVGAVVTAQRLDMMLTTIGAVSRAHVIVAGVWAPLPGQAAARALYAHLAPAVVARHPGASFLDTSGLLAPADLADGLHPDVSGYRKIARLWERSIRAYLLAGGRTQRPAPRPTELAAGFGMSAPIGRRIPVAVTGTSAAPAGPGNRVGPGLPGTTAPSARTPPGPARGPAAGSGVLPGHPSVPVPRSSRLVR